MPELSDHKNSDAIETQPQDINVELADAQLRKLNLEIENLEIESLKPKRKWYDGIVSYIPIITALLSMAAFVWGVVQFLDQQERDRKTREEDRISRDQLQYRTSYEQLLQFSTNPNITVQRALFLRGDLDHLIDSLYPPDKDDFTKEKNRLEKVLLKARIFDLINTECDFTQTRHVQLDIAAFQTWTDYEKDLKQSPYKTFIRKYLHAIQSLRTQDPKYFREVTYDPQVGYTVPAEPRSNSFASLVEGFGCQLRLLENDEKEEAINAFTRVTQNQYLTADLFRSDSNKPFRCQP